jgi:hypothetical protein
MYRQKAPIKYVNNYFIKYEEKNTQKNSKNYDLLTKYV